MVRYNGLRPILILCWVSTAIVLFACRCSAYPNPLGRANDLGTATAIHTLPWTLNEGMQLVQVPQCQVMLVESMPENLTYAAYSPKHASTYFAWSLLLAQAQQNLSIASFYWSLVAETTYNTSAIHEGSDIFEQIVRKSQQINVTIAQSGPRRNDSELSVLEASGARIHWVDVAQILGQGILHTKLWTVDGKHAYLGSANMDWRSLTEVKELGVLFLNCPSFVEELDKIHTTYCLAADAIPAVWPDQLTTIYNRTNPMKTTINGFPSRVYFTGSPVEFNPPGRTFDLDAILSVIASAKEFIYISVMDYSPEVVSYEFHKKGEYWPTIDDALRNAAVTRGVEVRMLISRWPYTPPSMLQYLMSLRQLNGIRGTRLRVRYFIVPAFTPEQRKIPHARVNHNKYMVTDQTAYIGTSNWSGDYFLYTGGAAFVVEDDTPEADWTSDDPLEKRSIRNQLVDIFYRDWNSEYSFEQ